MGGVYRRKVRICQTCEARPDTTAARGACEAAGHVLVVEEQPTCTWTPPTDAHPQAARLAQGFHERARVRLFRRVVPQPE
jgi:hypothetical protein